MKNLQLAKKIKELRKQKGLSQEMLSAEAQLNLRTIQRIEAGETEARGDTLQRLAAALSISPNDLVDWTEDEDRGFLTFLNLSALSFIAFPLLGIIVPLALWVLKKDKVKDLNQWGKRILNFQISWCILLCVLYAILFASAFFNINLSFLKGISLLNMGGVEIFVLLVPFFYTLNIAYVIINSYRSYKGKVTFYQPAIPFLR